MKNNKKGFTLIELLVVIAIIGLLSTLAVVALNNARQKARDARRLSDIKQIQTALELYYNDVGVYASSTDNATAIACDASNSAGDIGGCCLSQTNGFNDVCAGTTYMSEVPFNPTPRQDGTCPDQNYVYSGQTMGGTTNASYTLTYCIGQDNGNITGGTTHTATPAGIVDD